jgi:hypothetical protein
VDSSTCSIYGEDMNTPATETGLATAEDLEYMINSAGWKHLVGFLARSDFYWCISVICDLSILSTRISVMGYPRVNNCISFSGHNRCIGQCVA